jgi:hypothetical protein
VLQELHQEIAVLLVQKIEEVVVEDKQVLVMQLWLVPAAKV